MFSGLERCWPRRSHGTVKQRCLQLKKPRDGLRHWVLAAATGLVRLERSRLFPGAELNPSSEPGTVSNASSQDPFVCWGVTLGCWGVKNHPQDPQSLLLLFGEAAASGIMGLGVSRSSLEQQDAA